MNRTRLATALRLVALALLAFALQADASARQKTNPTATNNAPSHTAASQLATTQTATTQTATSQTAQTTQPATPRTGEASPAAAHGAEAGTQDASATQATGSANAVGEGSSDRLTFMDDLGERESAERPGTAGLLFRTLGALFLIVGLLLAAGWALRRYGGARFGASRADAPELSILSTVALGDKRSLAVVRFGDKTLLIGSTAQGITLLDSDAAEAASEGDEGDDPPPVRSVADLLRDDGDEALSFDLELSSASLRMEREAEAWRADGGVVR